MKTIFPLHIKPLSLLLLFCIPLLAMECERDEKDENNVSQNQEQYFSCKINGEIFTPMGQGTCYKWKTFYDPDGNLNANPGYLIFSATNCAMDGLPVVGIRVEKIFNSGIYLIDGDSLDIVHGYYSDFLMGSSSIEWSYHSFAGNVFFQEFEPQSYENNKTQEGWIEGTFEMSCANEAEDTIHITEGKFALILR